MRGESLCGTLRVQPESLQFCPQSESTESKPTGGFGLVPSCAFDRLGKKLALGACNHFPVGVVDLLALRTVDERTCQ